MQFVINNAIEGLFVREQVKQLLNCWVEGELTLEQEESKIYLLWQ